jgi:cytidylate kinase
LDALKVDARPTANGYELAMDGNPVRDRIRRPEVNAHVSTMAAVPAVRDWLLGALRAAGESGGLVADGRDIGSVVFPDAELKVFLVCQPEERARRRLLEQGVTDPTDQLIREEAARLLDRDRQDESREAAPLIKTDDAVSLETTQLDFEAQVRAVVSLARAVSARAARAVSA